MRRLYKTPAEREREAARDPLVNFADYLIRERIIDRNALQQIEHEIDSEAQSNHSTACLKADPPARGSALVNLYSGKVDPCV